MTEQIEIVPVIFRADKHGPGKGNVTAVFPTLSASSINNTVMCYAHLGQHGGCNKHWYRTTRPATPNEYADLLKELKGIYENPNDPDRVKLKIVKRWR